jgi:hypothetical protein
MANDLTGDISAALTRTAREVVASAIAGKFAADPLVLPTMSKLLSTTASVVKRHGTEIQNAVAAALKKSGRYIVMSNVSIPITQQAMDLLAQSGDRDLAEIRLNVDSPSDRMMEVDLVVVDLQASLAGGWEVKRGNGETELRKRRLIELDLRAVRLVLASYLSKCGYHGIKTVMTGIIDYYGKSKFSEALTITRMTIDERFGVPVAAAVDAMTEALRRALDCVLPDLFAKAMPTVTAAATALTRSGPGDHSDNGNKGLTAFTPVGPVAIGPRN